MHLTLSVDGLVLHAVLGLVQSSYLDQQTTDTDDYPRPALVFEVDTARICQEWKLDLQAATYDAPPVTSRNTLLTVHSADLLGKGQPEQ